MNSHTRFNHSKLYYLIRQLIVPTSIAAGLSALLTVPTATFAANAIWNVTNGSWTDPNSWSSANVPVNGDSAYINNGGSAVLNSGDTTASIYTFALGQNAGESGTLSIESGATFNTAFEFDVGRAGNGTLVLNNGAIKGGVFRIAFSSNSVGTVTINGGNITTANTENFTVGSSGTGTLIFNNGIVQSKSTFVGGEVGGSGVESDGGQGTAELNGNSQLNTTGNTVLGVDTNARGTVVMNDNSSMRSGTILVVGYYGQGYMTLNDNAAYIGTGNILVSFQPNSFGSLTINDAASVSTNGWMYVGYDTNSVGNLVLNNGNLTVNQTFSIGNSSGSTGTLVMENGTLNVSTGPTYAFFIGRNGDGHMTLKGGDVTSQSMLYIGTFSGSSGVLDIQGGTFIGTGANVGYQGTGTLTMTGGLLTVPSGTFLGVSTGGHGIANLNGGVLETRIVENAPGAGIGSLTFNGGTLRATEDNDDFIILPGTIAVGSGGAIIDSNGYTIGITPTFSGDSSSSLTKTGAGSLNLLTVNNTFFGNLIVDQGSLNLLQPDAMATARTIYIQSGGNLNTQDNNQILPQLSGAANGNVNSVNGILTLENPSGGDSLYAGNITSNEAVYKTGAGAITLSGQLQWTGETYLQEGNLILDGSAGAGQLTSNVIGQDGTQLSLQNGALLTGWVVPTNVNIDTSSRWNMTADSQVNNIVLANNGAVAFVPPIADGFKTLTVLGNLQGNNGLVVLNTRLGDDNSLTDKLVVEGNTAGTTRVQVNNAGGLGYQTTDGIEIITVAGQSNGEFVKDGRIVAGAYDYSLARGLNGNANNWYLTSRITPVDPEDPVDPSDPYDPKDPVLERPEPGAYTANLAAANNMFVTSLHDRLGETQYIDAFTGERKVTSMWMRNEGGHNRFRDNHDQLRTQANRYVLQLGGDIAQWTHNGQDRLHLGVMVGFGHTHSNTVSRMSGYDAKGTVNGYSIGTYGTWYANQADKSGLYVDGWLQYSWFNNSINGQDLPGEDYKSKGLTASVESGYTFKMGENSAKDIRYFIQPKGQLTWMGVKADDHRETNGTLVKGEGDGNLQTRLGVKTFMDIHCSVDQAIQPYIEITWVHNSKDFGTNMNGISIKQDGALNIAELKLGVEGQVNKQVNLWGNVSQQVGNEGYSDTAVMVGAKYNF